MGHTWKKSSNWKNGTHLEKWFTSGQTVHNWKNESNSEKWVTFGKIGHT